MGVSPVGGTYGAYKRAYMGLVMGRIGVYSFPLWGNSPAARNCPAEKRGDVPPLIPTKLRSPIRRASLPSLPLHSDSARPGLSR